MARYMIYQCNGNANKTDLGAVQQIPQILELTPPLQRFQCLYMYILIYNVPVYNLLYTNFINKYY